MYCQLNRVFRFIGCEQNNMLKNIPTPFTIQFSLVTPSNEIYSFYVNHIMKVLKTEIMNTFTTHP